MEHAMLKSYGFALLEAAREGDKDEAEQLIVENSG
jgi:hypothetical protein